MIDETGMPDMENPPFDFSQARRRRAGEPVSSEAARLRRALRESEKAEDPEAVHEVARRALQVSWSGPSPACGTWR